MLFGWVAELILKFLAIGVCIGLAVGGIAYLIFR